MELFLKKMIEYEVAHRGLTHLEITDTLAERKDCLAYMADAFVILPGGLGTMDEMFECLTYVQLGVFKKQCIAINIEGFFEPLRKYIDHMVEHQFLERHAADHLTFVDTVAEAVELLGVSY